MRLRYLLPAATAVGWALLAGHPAAAQAAEPPPPPELGQLLQLPSLELPPLELPPLELPPLQLPQVPVPQVQLPPLELPPVAVPQLELPPIELPALELPALELPPVDFTARVPVVVESPLVVGPEGQVWLDTTRRAEGPAYHWVSDGISQLLAAHPGPVLHRVNGSFFHAPDVPREARLAQLNGQILVGPGTPLFLGTQDLCTLTAAGFDSAGNKIGLTAGHCARVGDKVYSADAWENGPAGVVAAKATAADVALIHFGPQVQPTRRYGETEITSIGPVPSAGVVCKQGIATGRSCGPTLYVTQRNHVSQVCAMQGDSGAPLLVGNQVVGMVTGGVSQLLACRSPLQGPVHVPTLSLPLAPALAEFNSRGQLGAGFHLPAT